MFVDVPTTLLSLTVATFTLLDLYPWISVSQYRGTEARVQLL